MRIIKCHIENFGKLSNADYNFTDGLNVINEVNGAGKSTLAAFIRVMFFGFANEGKRNDIENERKRYKPWQGGVYGGNITFSVGSRTYKVHRIFGAKDKDDEFTLLDADTLIPSDDFTSQLGEEILKIDHDSFCRTVYIAQGSCETGATDSISAKIGNLAENTDDINNFENVNKKLTDKINSLSATRKTGAISKLKKEINELETDIRRGSDLDAAQDNLVRMRNQEKKKLAALKAEQAELQNKIRKLSSYKEIKSKREQYLNLKNQLAVRKNVVDASGEYFKGRIPKTLDIDAAIVEAGKLAGYKQSMAIYSVDEKTAAEGLRLERLFANGVPSDVEINDAKKLVAKMNETAMSALKADDVYKHGDAKKGRNIKAAICIVMLIAAIAFGAFNQYIVSAFCVIAGIIGVAVCGIINRKSGEQEDTDDAISKYNELRESLDAFVSRYCEGELPNPEMYGSWIGELEKNVHVYKQYMTSKREYNSAQDNFKRCMENVHDFIESLSMNVSDDVIMQLQDIRDRKKTYEFSKAEYEKVLGEIQAFEADNDISKLNEITVMDEQDISLDELNVKLRDVTNELGRISQNISDYTLQIDKGSVEREAINEAEERLEKAREEYNELIHKLEVVKKTQEYLERAKTNFTARYMQPLMSGFNKYYNMLSEGSSDKYEINANMQISVEEAGMQRDVKLLSYGYQDMAGICMRMALIDAMYEGEKPFVVFDDPFVNLDNGKIKGGINFLGEISKEYQIIYFTCHDSRV